MATIHGPDFIWEQEALSSEDGARTRSFEYMEGLVLAFFVLVVTAVLGYGWMSHRLLEVDEFLSFYTDSQPTMARVVQVQLHSPISLDPPTYHLLSHLAMRVVGNTATGLRLPALLGFLMFQASVFVFVSRISGQRSAVIAMLFPVLTITFFYAADGRPYGLLLGLYGMSLACWQSATRELPGRLRTTALLGLAAALVLGVTSHFFGVLLLIPVCAGELARTIKARKLDWAVVSAIGVGAASVALVLPFQKAAAEYRIHYYSTRVVWNVIPQSYAALFIPHHTLPLNQQHVYVWALGIGMVVVAIGLVSRWKARRELNHEFVALVTLGLLPVFGFLLGRFVTHTTDVRYVVATMFAATAGLGITLERALRSRMIFYACWVVLLGASANRVIGYTRGAVGSVEDLPRRFQLSPAVAAALAEDPGAPIFVQSLGDFYADSYYDPDPGVRSRFALVYSQEEELGWLGHDTNYLTARNMTHFAPLRIVRYRDLLSGSAHPLVLQYRDGWDWLARDLEARHVGSRSIGALAGGELVQLQLDEEAPGQTAKAGTDVQVPRVAGNSGAVVK